MHFTPGLTLALPKYLHYFIPVLQYSAFNQIYPTCHHRGIRHLCSEVCSGTGDKGIYVQSVHTTESFKE